MPDIGDRVTRKSNTNLFVEDSAVSLTNPIPIDNNKTTKGNTITILNNITSTTTSSAIDTRSYSYIDIRLEITSGVWNIEGTGCDTSTGEFVSKYLGSIRAKCTGASISRSYPCPASTNYMKIKATRVGDSGQMTVKITPLIEADIELPGEELIHFHTQFVNDTYGDDMTQNAGPGSIDYIVYGENVDSSATGEWIGSAITGVWDFASTDESHSGTVSVDGSATVDGDIAEFDAEVAVDLTGSIFLTGWIILTAYPAVGTKSINIYGYYSGATVGTSANLFNYIDTAELDVWQPFIIPLAEMDLSTATISSIRIETSYSLAASQVDFYLDDIHITQGTRIEYRVTPPDDTELIITHIGMVVCASYDSTLANATVPNIPCETFMGLTLSNGLRYHVEVDGVIIDDDTMYDLLDFMTLMDMHIVNHGGNATELWIYMEHNLEIPLRLKGSTDDHLSVELLDNFSSLVRFNWTAGGGGRLLTDIASIHSL